MPKDKSFKKDKFKVVRLTGSEAATLLVMMRQANHPDAQDETAYEIVEALEGQGKEPKDKASRDVGVLTFDDELAIALPIKAHEYLPSVFTQLKPPGYMLKSYIGMKKAVANAESVSGRKLIDKKWRYEDGCWFPGEIEFEDGDSEAEETEDVEETPEAPEGSEEERVEQPVGATG